MPAERLVTDNRRVLRPTQDVQEARGTNMPSVAAANGDALETRSSTAAVPRARRTQWVCEKACAEHSLPAFNLKQWRSDMAPNTEHEIILKPTTREIIRTKLYFSTWGCCPGGLTGTVFVRRHI